MKPSWGEIGDRFDRAVAEMTLADYARRQAWRLAKKSLLLSHISDEIVLICRQADANIQYINAVYLPREGDG